MTTRKAASIFAFSCVCLLAGCSRKPDTAMPSGGRIVNVQVLDLPGLSGLARDDASSLFAVPEDIRVLLELSVAGAEQHRYRVSGVPEGVEFESLAWLGKGRFAIGTEGGCKDGSEHVLVVEREGDGAKVVRDIAMPLRAWGAECDDKRGVEGLCAAGGKLIAAIENPLSGKNDERFAAIARIDEQTGEVTAYRLTLTTKTGKIAGLECREKDGAIEVLAIERHFEVSRLLSFTVPLGGAAEAAPRSARLVLDLFPYANGGKRNFEGVVWLDDRRAMLVVDNKYGSVTGPNEMVEVDLAGK